MIKGFEIGSCNLELNTLNHAIQTNDTKHVFKLNLFLLKLDNPFDEKQPIFFRLLTHMQQILSKPFEYILKTVSKKRTQFM